MPPACGSSAPSGAWHQVSVVLLHNAPRQAAFKHWSPPLLVLARWTQPGEPVRIQEFLVPPGSRARSTVRVWAFHSGPVGGAPLTNDELTAREIAAGILAPVSLAIVFLGLARAARWLLDRRRLAGWEAAWRQVGPQWTR